MCENQSVHLKSKKKKIFFFVVFYKIIKIFKNQYFCKKSKKFYKNIKFLEKNYPFSEKLSLCPYKKHMY